MAPAAVPSPGSGEPVGVQLQGLRVQQLGGAGRRKEGGRRGDSDLRVSLQTSAIVFNPQKQSHEIQHLLARRQIRCWFPERQGFL